MRVSITAAVNAVPRSTVPAYLGVAHLLPQAGMLTTSYRGGEGAPLWTAIVRAADDC
jgi:hypothetical protein